MAKQTVPPPAQDLFFKDRLNSQWSVRAKKSLYFAQRADPPSRRFGQPGESLSPRLDVSPTVPISGGCVGQIFFENRGIFLLRLLISDHAYHSHC